MATVNSYAYVCGGILEEKGALPSVLAEGGETAVAGGGPVPGGWSANRNWPRAAAFETSLP